MLALCDEVLALFLFETEFAVARKNATCEQLRINGRTLESGRCLERYILHIAGLVAEDGAQKFFFRRWIRFALRRDLSDEDVTFADLCADADDTAIVEILCGFFTHVRNFTCELFFTALCVANLKRVLFDVDGREYVLCHHALADHDSIFEVVPAPWHEGHHHVTSKSEFAHVR